MGYVFMFFILAMLFCWIFGIIVYIFQRKTRDKIFAYGIVAGTFMLIGALGFFGSAFLSCGGGRFLPNSFEWPMGFSEDVLITSKNYYVVPHYATSRLQIYDNNLNFICGWYIEALTKPFRTMLLYNGNILVKTADEKEYFFNLKGENISNNYNKLNPNSYKVLRKEKIKISIPTFFPLYVFSSPVYSWCCSLLGGIMFGILEKNFYYRNNY